MSRDDTRGVETEFEPASRGRVLRNLLGIRSVREMSHAESAALVHVQEQLVDLFSPDHCFSAFDICAMHRAWLGHIYPWAGQYRTVQIAKGDFPFAAAGQVPRLMINFEHQVLQRHTPCRHTNHDEIAGSLAIVHAELILIHPFREGNGRCARLLALLMGLQADLPPLDFGGQSGRGRRDYIAAIHAAMGSDYSPMTAIFRAVIRRSLRQHTRQPQSG